MNSIYDNKPMPLMELGLLSPKPSQEEAEVDYEDADMAKTYDVDWLDTDISEDEDFLPQQQHRPFPSPSFHSYEEECSQARKRTRMHSLSSHSKEILYELMMGEPQSGELSSCELARRVIDGIVDTGVERVDLSHLELTEIPDEIAELRYVTVVQKDLVKPASLQVFLYANRLSTLNPNLFQLSNLSVLSLRNNRLTELPPEIALLVNLVELSLGNNLLQWLPAELLRLPKLTILSLCPNPFLPLENHTRRRQVFAQPVCSLAEIATRQLLADGKWTDPCHEGHAILPCGLKERLGQVSLVNICEQCKKQYASSSVQDFIWQTVKGTHDIAVRYRFCSIQCSNILHAKLMSADNS